MKDTMRVGRSPLNTGSHLQPGPLWSYKFVAALFLFVIPLVSTAEEDAAFFHEKVEPLLRRFCFGCHSHQSGQMESGLALDWKSGWMQGGRRGPAIVPGHPENSLLVRAIQHRDPELRMPEEKLADQHIETLIEWIRRGAYDDRIAPPQPADPLDWWSLKTLTAPPVPAVPQEFLAEAGNPLDVFVAARLAERGLTWSPPASPRELIRRLYVDLTGLPPTPEQAAWFLSDPSADNYNRLVDELLASPRYGERWARHWFDTIHFADSHGYEHDVGRDHAWPYRDYVIQALNRDLPWAEFIRQQLAVDEFQPEATDLIPALGFLGAGTFDYSTYQTAPVTFDYLDRDDMVTQTISAFLSTTIHCARCHAHKFDPVTQEDYYALQAVFAGILKGDIPYDPDPLTGAERRRLTALRDAALRRDPAVLTAETSQQIAKAWLAQRGSGPIWKPLEWLSFVATEGSQLTLDDRGILIASGTPPEVDTYILTGRSSLAKITALRLDLYPHPSLPMQGPGRCQNGNLHLSEISVMHFSPSAPTGTPVAIHQATADFNQEGWSVEQAFDGNTKTAWGIYPLVGQPHHAVFEFSSPLDLTAGSVLTVTLKQLHGGAHLIGALQVSVTDAPPEQARALPQEVERACALPDDARPLDLQLALAAYALKHFAETELRRLPPPATVYAVGRTVAIPLGSGKSQGASLTAPKIVHLLERGEILQPRQVVSPGAIQALRHAPARFALPTDAPESARRAALAEWIAHPENVLTWRSVVNRVWHYHFGRGLCDTPSDLGRMGGTPSHPELIDWLAVWFRDQAQGSLKQLHRLIVTSRTYQQSSAFNAKAQQLDAENRWLWRQHRLRMDADTFRDAVLALSGRLDDAMGGPAIQHFSQSPGAQLTPKLDYASFDWSTPGVSRRSIYRYVWRGIPDPLMAALDFPDLGMLAPTRSSSASPLQALVLYNNSFVLFHSEAMARELSQQTTEPEIQIQRAVQRVWLRSPTASELADFKPYVHKHGLAAFCRVLLNSHEFLFLP